MALFTLGERSEAAAGSVGSTLAVVLQLRLRAFAGALFIWVAFTLIALAFDGWDNLAVRSFAALLTGEGVALLAMTVPAFRLAPLAAIIHLAVTTAWVFFLFSFGSGWWVAAWKAVGLPGV